MGRHGFVLCGFVHRSTRLHASRLFAVFAWCCLLDLCKHQGQRSRKSDHARVFPHCQLDWFFSRTLELKMPDIFTVIYEAIGTLGIVVILGGLLVATWWIPPERA